MFARDFADDSGMRGYGKKRQAFRRLIWYMTGVFLLCIPGSSLALTATTTALSLSSASQASGAALTLTATVTAGSIPVTLGTIVFCNAGAAYCIDSAVVGTAQLTSAGTASIKIIPGIGVHSYKAIFRSTSTYATSTSTGSSMTVSGTFPTTTALSKSGSAGNYTLTGRVVSTGSLTVSPTGSVTFTDASNGNLSLGSATLGASTFSQSFSLTSASSVGSAPRLAAPGDFNGDGIPDVVISNQNSSNITILLGTGAGNFTAAPQSPITTGSTVIAVATGDFNNDGKLDIVAVNYNSGSFSVLLGNGDGTFQPAMTVTGIYEPDTIAVGDFNGDGNLDLAVNSQGWNDVIVYFGNGTGAFTQSSSYNTGSQPYSIVAQDLNGDGNLDLAIGNSNASSVTVLLGSAAGTFTAATGSPFATGAGAQSVALADLNGDGKLDLIVGDASDANISILNGNGDGTFQTFSSYTLATGLKPIATGDFNQDGKQDLAVCNSSALSILLGNGDSTFQASQSYSMGSGGCSGILAADFNGDGFPDVEVGLQGNNTSTVLLNQATHTASAFLSSVSVPGSGSHNVAAAYAGDTQNTASTSSTRSFTASKIATSLALFAAPTSSSYGQQVVLTGVLSPYLVGNLTANGETITFYNGGSSLGTATLASGAASLNVTSLPPGTDSITAVYATDANFLASTSSAINYAVSKATPTITWAMPSSISYGTALSSTQLNASSGGVAGTFVYTPASGTILGTGNGQTLSVSFTPTDPTSYNSASGSTAINVAQASGSVLLTASAASSPYGSAMTLTATVPSAATGTVTFLDGGVAIGTAVLNGTTATFTSSSFAVGSHSLTASWPGDANHASATSTVLTHTITRAAATVAEISSINPSVFGDTLTLSITISGAGATPTGTVVLQDGAITIATLTLNAGGFASLAVSALVAGSHTLTATYQGDTNYF